MAKLRGKKLWQTVGSSALAVITFVGVAVGISALVKKADEDMQVIYPTYEIGGLTEDGKYEDTEGTIYTKEAFKCQGLTIKPEFDSVVKYQIFFYDGMGEFVSATEVMEKAYNSTIPESATEARIEITPDWSFLGVKDKDEQIVKWYEVTKYSKQIEVSVLKDQEIDYELQEFRLVSLQGDCVEEVGICYSETGVRGDYKAYVSYVYTETASTTFYIESELVPFQYVVVNKAGAVRYQKTNGTYVGGIEHQFDLNAGDKVMISFLVDRNPEDVYFYVANRVKM